MKLTHKKTYNYPSVVILILLLFTKCNRNITPSYQYENSTIVSNITTNEFLDCSCHTQGVGWSENTDQIIVTCEGKDDFSYILLFSDYKEPSKIKLLDIIKNDAEGRQYAHPSAIQIFEGLLPVAIANKKKDSTFIYFYDITKGNIEKNNVPIIVYPKHLGALAINKIEQKIILLGMGWDSDYYALWTSDAEYQFKLMAEGKLSEIANGKLGAYNSIWLGKKETGENILIASCGSFFNKKNNFIDIFLVNYENENISLQKKDRIYVENTTQKTTKSLFFEGVTVREIQGDSIKIIATPQDFVKQKKKIYLKRIYEGYLFPITKIN